MSASDIILARTALRTAITHLRKARTGPMAPALRDSIDRSIFALEEQVCALTRALYEANHGDTEGARA